MNCSSFYETGKDLKPETRNAALLPTFNLTFRFMRSGEERTVCDLVNRVFDTSVAYLYPNKGLLNFKKYADPEELLQRIHEDHFVLVALAEGELAGMIEARRYGHISLLFVDSIYQGHGIGRDLLKLAVELCLTNNPQLRAVTVNSSPNAVKAYERMGFNPTGMEQSIGGVRSVPMEKVLGEKGDPKAGI